jgi:hypothetical protein
MRNGFDRESNPRRPQRWQAPMLISNIDITTDTDSPSSHETCSKHVASLNNLICHRLPNVCQILPSYRVLGFLYKTKTETMVSYITPASIWFRLSHSNLRMSNEVEILWEEILAIIWQQKFYLGDFCVRITVLASMVHSTETKRNRPFIRGLFEGTLPIPPRARRVQASSIVFRRGRFVELAPILFQAGSVIVLMEVLTFHIIWDIQQWRRPWLRFVSNRFILLTNALTFVTGTWWQYREWSHFCGKW